MEKNSFVIVAKVLIRDQRPLTIAVTISGERDAGLWGFFRAITGYHTNFYRLYCFCSGEGAPPTQLLKYLNETPSHFFNL